MLPASKGRASIRDRLGRDKAVAIPCGADASYRDVYRIHHGFQGNVDQFDEGGKQAVCRWCFGPEVLVVTGDTMLAQKIALETDESAALRMANSTIASSRQTD